MSKTFLNFPYIINFCNLTQVRTTTGFVRSIRRVTQAPYPLVKVQPDEIGFIAGKHRAFFFFLFVYLYAEKFFAT